MGKKRKRSKKQEQDALQPLAKAIVKIFEAKPGNQYTFNQVYKKLVQPATKDEVFQALALLERKGRISVNEHGKFSLGKEQIPVVKHTNSQTVTGVVDLTQSGSAYIISPELDQDVFVARGNLLRAFDGDRVKVTLRKGRGKRLEGEIVEVLDRARHDIVGTIEVSGDFAFVVPDKRKIPIDIFIPPGQVGDVRDGDRVICQIVNWPDNKKNPEGRVTERLGALGNNDVEMKSILVENGFPLEFSESVKKEVADLQFEIPEAALQDRRDFRAVTTFTIDPEDAKDFDDALSIRKLDNGHWEVGVHIADVSYYVRPGTALDKEAYLRGTSVYLVDRVLPMLPEELSNIVCSLRPNETKLTYSAVFELDDKATVHNRWFGRTAIHSDRRFTYEEAQTLIEGEEGDFAAEVRQLNALALHLREKKFANGAIAFETTEVKFKVDVEGKPLGVYLKERKEAHMMIEDFMLLANKEVAYFANHQKRNEKTVPFVYRIHDQPDMEKLIDFARMANTFGYQINIQSPDQVQQSLNELMEAIHGKPEQDVLEQLAIRSMAKAVYSTHNIGHYGLAFSHYTHFTSPIRRYPDVLVHRILDDLLTSNKFKPVDKLEDKCVRCSWMERKAMDAERESVKYKQAEFMQLHIGEEFDGIITGVVNFGLFVEIIENKCEGLVDIDSIQDDYYAFYEKENALLGRSSGKRYRLGDKVRIKVIKTDVQQRRIDFELV